MKIFYDHQVFSLQDAGGASRYFYELMYHLSTLPDVSLTAYMGWNRSILPLQSLRERNIDILSWRSSLRPGLGRYALNEAVTSSATLMRVTCDIYHPTLYRRIAGIRARHIVATHHDCVHERFPGLFPDGQRVISAKRRLYKRADAIICVSQSSRDDLLQFYGVEREKAHVVYHGMKSFAGLNDVPDLVMRPTQRPYLLYVGARYSYKNFSGLITAYANGGFAREYDLVAVGGGNFTDEEKLQFRKLGVASSVRHLDLASESILASTYRNARLFVYPSLYEGFGFPPLEAMSLGCPVLAADNSSIPEVCGNAALYCSAADPANLERGLRDALHDPEQSARVMRGYERVLRYNWMKCAQETLGVYKGL